MSLDEHARAGLRAIEEQRFDDAIKAFEAALAVAPERPDMNNALGMAYLHRGDVGNALPHLERAIALAEPYDQPQHQRRAGPAERDALQHAHEAQRLKFLELQRARPVVAQERPSVQQQTEPEDDERAAQPATPDDRIGPSADGGGRRLVEFAAGRLEQLRAPAASLVGARANDDDGNAQADEVSLVVFVRIVERRPVAIVPGDGGEAVIDAAGVVLGGVAADTGSLPRLVGIEPGSEAFDAVASVLVSVPSEVLSATQTIEKRRPRSARWRTCRNTDSQANGTSGIRMVSAPPAMPPASAIQPA
jgi:hypothetical protein